MNLKARLEQEFLPFVIKPARYLGNEFNTVHKELADVELRIALCSLSVYEQGIADLNFEIPYYVLNSETAIWCERFFLPSQDAATVLSKKRIPLFSLESKTALNEFDIILFTFHSELQYTRLISMLKLGNIPPRAENIGDVFPLVMGCANFNWNPEPVAEFLDVVVIGNWQAQILEISQKALKTVKENANKTDFLNQLNKIKGVYLPSGYQPAYSDLGEFSNLKKLNESLPASIESTKNTPDDNKHSYSIDPLFSILRPDYSDRDTEISFDSENDSEINPSFKKQFQQYISLEGEMLSLMDVNIGHIWNEVKEKIFLSNQKLNFSFPDFRIENKEISLDDMKFIKKDGADIFAYTGSIRLRTLMNRHYRDEDLYRLLSYLAQTGFTKIKLRFLIGLPTEKDEDINQLINIIKKCVEIINPIKDVQLTVYFSPFIPKPFSAFQWEGMESRSKLQAKYNLLQQKLEGLKISLLFEDIQKSRLNVILSRGDRSLSEMIDKASAALETIPEEETGYSVWENQFNTKDTNWEKLLEPISVTVPLPWDHLDYGVSKYQLKKERLEALQGKIDSTISNTVHLGKGISRDKFEDLVKNSELELTKETNQDEVTEQTEAIQYGRQAKRQVKPTTTIKKKIRVHYTKTGPARFLSHLDVARIFQIAARKAAVLLVYTQGKSPHPKFSFGPPLPIGITSLAEYLDMEIEIKNGTDIQSKLNSVFPEGIQIVQYKILFAKVPALSAVINLADYKINSSDTVFSKQIVTDWMKSDEVWVESKVKDEIHKINIRPYVVEMRVDDNEFYIRTQAVEGKMARITDVLDSLKIQGENDQSSFVIQRIGQFVEKDGEVFTPFDMA